MPNEPRRCIRNDVLVVELTLSGSPIIELTEDQMKQVSGGVRDAASGLASGQPSHHTCLLQF